MENSAFNRPEFPIKGPAAKPRAVVALSGGVDSAVTAALLKERGYAVSAVSLRMWPGACMADAQRAAEALEIPLEVIEAGALFRKQVIEPFIRAYQHGQTPNPCVLCNRFLKFGLLLEYARERKALLATGHYAQVVKRPEGLALHRAQSLEKDQSYFLFNLKEAQLEDIVFPLGGFSKCHIRRLAQGYGLEVASKPDSMEVCFIPGSYRAFLEAEGLHMPGGDIVDTGGNVLGRHEGLHRYTLGQRRGLGNLGKPTAQYVVRLEAAHNRLVVGEKAEVFSRRFALEAPSWVRGEPPLHRRLRVCIRHQHAGAMGQLQREGEGYAVELEEAVAAPTPGQAAVFYEAEEVLGGGWIGPPQRPILTPSNKAPHAGVGLKCTKSASPSRLWAKAVANGHFPPAFAAGGGPCPPPTTGYARGQRG